MNILCIQKMDNTLIRRISLSSNLQNSLPEYLKESISYFDNAKKISFSGEYKPDQNEVLELKNFQNPYSDLLNPLNLQTLSNNEIENIKCIVFNIGNADKNLLAFQTFDNRKIIRPKKWHLIYSKDTFSKIDEKGLIIDSKIDALYYPIEQKLLFSSYHNTSRIFELSDYLREATEKETNDFIKNEIFKISNEISTDLFNSKMRKKIYLIKKNDILEKVKDKFEEVKKYAHELGLSLDECFDKEKKIILPNDKNKLKKIINFLNDDLFKSPISDFMYETNSKMIINNYKK